MSFHNVLGQTQALNIIRQSLQNGNLAHAYLFFGPSGIGKKRSALEFAKSLNCENKGSEDNCGVCNSCNKIEKGLHPDCFILEPSKSSSNAKEETIRIDDIRNLQKKLNYLPYEGEFKVAIVDDAEKMNLQAANSFLKTLEEPPRSTLIILVSSNHYQLLPTIVSRCQGVKFSPLPLKALVQILSQKEDIAPEEIEIRARHAGGTLERATSNRLLEISQFREELLNLLEHHSFDNMDQMFQWSKLWSKKSEQLQDMLVELMYILRDLTIISAHCNSELIMNQDLSHYLSKLATLKSLSAWIKMFQAAVQTRQALKNNQNTQLSLDLMLIEFCEAA